MRPAVGQVKTILFALIDKGCSDEQYHAVLAGEPLQDLGL